MSDIEKQIRDQNIANQAGSNYVETLRAQLEIAKEALININNHQNCRDSFDICKEALQKIGEK